MKKNWKNRCVSTWMCVIIFLFMLGGPTTCWAQHSSIEFSETTWKKQLNQARKEKKLIFLDCHTKWCSFCRVLEKYIFTDQRVADFYNQHFINVQMDMEEGIGIELRKKYGVFVYPTLLFINALGEVEDAQTGYVEAEGLIDLGKRAMNPEKNLLGAQRKYAAGERNPVFLRDYLRILSKTGKTDLMKQIIQENLVGLEDQQFYTSEVWEVIAENGEAALPLMMSRVVKHRDGFDQLVGKVQVDSVLDATFTSKVKGLILSSRRKSFSPEECRQMIEFLLNQDVLPHAAEYLAALYVAENLNKKEYARAVEILKETENFHFYRKDTRDHFLNCSLREVAARCEDQVVCQAGVELLDSLKPSVIPENKQAMYEATRDMLLKKE